MIAVDAHVHIYPAYALTDFFHDTAVRIRQQAGLEPSDRPAILLTEKQPFDFFNLMVSGEQPLPGGELEPTDEASVICVRQQGEELLVAAGRQIATAERIEFASYFCPAIIPDGLSAQETIEQILSAGGVPALLWAPGKWMFGRHAIIKELLQTHQELLTCDSSLRGRGWPEPELLQLTGRTGFDLLGTDPFAWHTEIRRAGTCGVRYDVPPDAAQAGSQLRRLVQSRTASVFGSRVHVPQMLARIARGLLHG